MRVGGRCLKFSWGPLASAEGKNDNPVCRHHQAPSHLEVSVESKILLLTNTHLRRGRGQEKQAAQNWPGEHYAWLYKRAVTLHTSCKGIQADSPRLCYKRNNKEPKSFNCEIQGAQHRVKMVKVSLSGHPKAKVFDLWHLATLRAQSCSQTAGQREFNLVLYYLYDYRLTWGPLSPITGTIIHWQRHCCDPGFSMKTDCQVKPLAIAHFQKEWKPEVTVGAHSIIGSFGGSSCILFSTLCHPNNPITLKVGYFDRRSWLFFP